MAWTPVLHIVITKTSCPNCTHAPYTSMKHGHQNISPVWAV